MRVDDPEFAEQTATEVISVVRDFVESLRAEFRPRKQAQQILKDVPLFTKLNTREIPQKIRSIRDRIENENSGDGQDVCSSDSSSFHEQRRKVLSEVALPLSQLLASSYTILDSLPETPLPTKSLD